MKVRRIPVRQVDAPIAFGAFIPATLIPPAADGCDLDWPAWRVSAWVEKWSGAGAIALGGHPRFGQ